jgi:hypothetical protein
MTTGTAANRSEMSGNSRAKWCRSEGCHPGNMHEQAAAKETMENCEEEVHQTESGINRLLTRGER